MIEILQFLSNKTSQGWILTFFSSIICISGTLIIYFDDLYYLLFPRSITSRYRFKLKENYSFLNGSLALSSGCLIITSLYRLLPEAHKYLLKSQQDENETKDVLSKRQIQFNLMISYFGGILICLFFNFALHLLTSESVVHCNHGSNVKGEDEEAINHHYDGHHHSYDNSKTNHYHQHSHSHSNNHETDTPVKPSRVDDPHSSEIQEYFPHQNPPHQHNHSVHMEVRDDENTPLIRKTLKPRKSLIQMFLSHSNDEETAGECKGYSSAELCTYKNHEHSNGSQDKLHFCEIPQLTNNQNDDGSTEVEEDENHHHHHDHNHEHHQQHQHEQIFHSNQSHHSHEIDHHHHVNSPLSRLLLIGIQTTLAITLHKLPEGFITYITSETNPKLGISIFISLILHNFTEGFSMCLPLYYSMSQSSNFPKLKAVMISSLLGGLSQPLGAVLGFLFLKFNSKNYNLTNLNFIFGITMSITSGFLTVIALSMYGSAVSFGGDMNFVMIWCIVGIIIIGISTIFSTT